MTEGIALAKFLCAKVGFTQLRRRRYGAPAARRHEAGFPLPLPKNQINTPPNSKKSSCFFVPFVVKKSFSFIELIVVVKVLVILCVLLLLTAGSPALRSRVEEVSCRNNLKDICVAIMLYEDLYGTMPYAYHAEVEPPSYRTWYGLLLEAGLLEADEPTSYPNATNCQLLRCPQSAELKLAEDYYHYGINGHLPNLLKIPAGKGQVNWRRAAVRSIDISKPAQRLLVGDATSFILGGPATERGPNGSARYPHENTSMNAVFLDGRVENIQEKNLQVYYEYGTMFARF